MKTIKSILLLSVLLLGLGTFAYAQFTPVDCTIETIEGRWLDVIGSRLDERVEWRFEEFDLPTPGTGGLVSCSTSSSPQCFGLYPDGIPLGFVLEDLEDPKEIEIFWSQGEIDYRCFTNADGNMLRLISKNPPISAFEFLSLDRPGGEVIASVPTLSEWGLIAMSGVMGIVGFMVIWRNRVTA